MMTGAIAILVMIFMPMGLVGLPAQVRGWRRARRLKVAVAAASGSPAAVGGPGATEPPAPVGEAREGVTAMALLEVTELSRHFGGLAAVNKVDLTVEEGEILGLIGPNGAGKSTMLNLIDGTLKVSSGTIMFGGHNVTRYPPHRRARMGIARVFQKNALFKSMTVLENVLAGMYLQHQARPLRRHRTELRARAEAGRRLSTRCTELLGIRGPHGQDARTMRQPSPRQPAGIVRRGRSGFGPHAAPARRTAHRHERRGDRPR